jgi:hypothetical protein
MTGKKKDPNKEYNGWGGKREGAGGKKGQVNVGHNGGRKPPEKPKRQRNVYCTEEEFEALKKYLWDVLRAGQSQANRKDNKEQKQDGE